MAERQNRKKTGTPTEPEKAAAPRALSRKEADLVQLQIKSAERFIATFSPEDANGPITLEALDRALRGWIELRVTDPNQIKVALGIVAATLGDFLVRDAGFRWVIATQESGPSLAVMAGPKATRTIVLLNEFVAKRYFRGEVNFLAWSFRRLQQQAEAGRSAEDH